MTSASHTATDESGHRSAGRCRRTGRCNGGNWSAFNIAAMVVGFVVFWPIGLFVLFWICSGREVQDLPGAIRRQWSSFSDGFSADHASRRGRDSDNVVFNEYRQAQYERVREIKDEIKTRARRFRDFRANAQRRRDEKEFEDFMSQGPGSEQA